MADTIRPVADSPMDISQKDGEPDSVATPEGDNEGAPDQPLQPSSDIAVAGLQTPRGAEPDDEYKKDKK